MNEEQTTPADDTETGEATGERSLTTGGTPSSQPVPPADSATSQDDYYAVDHAKKDVISTIGDGEMHDEGLVGAGELPSDIQSSTERLSDEQDEAELHDSEG